MNLHRIADLTVDMGYKYDRLKNQAKSYRIAEETEPSVTIYLGDEFIQRACEENSGLTPEIAEYLYTGNVFYAGLVKYGGFMLHSSAVLMDGTAYLFSAPSGTGKSTHTSLWQEAFGSDKAKILNDDKPAIRVEKDGIYAFGTPWSGKTDLSINVKAKIGGICFLSRGDKNEIRRENGGAMLSKLFAQTVRPTDEADMDMLLKCLEITVKCVPIYSMKCTISKEAAIMAYNEMRKKG